MIAEWIAKRVFKRLLRKIKKKALNPEQIAAFGKALRRNWEEKLEGWAKSASETESEYDDAAILLAQVVFKSSYIEKKRNGGGAN